MVRTCLVSVFGPQNILPAIVAVKYYGIFNKKDPASRVITIVHNPGLPENIMEECSGIIEEMIRPFGWEPPILLKNKDIEQITKTGIFPTHARIRKLLQEKMGTSAHIDEIFFCHNLVGYASDLCLSSFPDAEWIILGDGFGFLYDQKYLDFLSGLPTPSKVPWYLQIMNFIRSVYPRPEVHIPLGAKTNVCAIIPYDWSGEFLVDKNLIIIPREFAQDVVRSCAGNLQDLNQYCRNLTRECKEMCFVIIMSNFSDAQLLSLEDEVIFWVNIVRKYIPKESTIIIKPHPFSVNPLVASLIEVIKPEYTILTISEEYNRYPFELWLPVIERSQIISLTTTMISLPYLNNKTIIDPMTEELIESMFPQKSWDYLKDTEKRYKEILCKISGNDYVEAGT